MKKGCRASPVRVGGLTPLTTIDYPGELAAGLFLQGCPWRCGYCHNHDLISRRGKTTLPWQQVVEFLDRRRGLLDAVVFSGGEPTLHAGLGEAMHEIKSLGFKIGLHTAGVYPERLRALLPQVDWIGMDFKASRSGYETVTGVRGSAERAWKSARLILASGVACEFRTTLHPDLLDPAQLELMASELGALGVDSFVIQRCISERCRDPSLRQVMAPVPDNRFFARIAGRFEHFSLRNY